MSFLAKLHLDDQDYNVLECEYTFTQSTDLNGKPAARPKGGKINIKIESTGSQDFFDWMVSATAKKSGQITFYRRESDARMKELSFNDAFCVFFKEVFTSTGENPMIIDLEISAKELKMGESMYENPWVI